jgi:hypothetical protein
MLHSILAVSMFEEIAIAVDGSIVHAPMHQRFAAFHDEGFRGWIMDGAKTNPGPLLDRGSNEDILVELMGLCSNPLWAPDLGERGTRS